MPSSAFPGEPITITGLGLSPGVVIHVGGIPVAATSSSMSELVFLMPPAVPCDTTVTVANACGTATVGFNPAPVVTSTVLSSGPAAGGNFFSILGTGFSPGTTVTIGGNPATPIITTATTLLVSTPPGPTGPTPVVITTPGGCTTTTTYTYL